MKGLQCVACRGSLPPARATAGRGSLQTLTGSTCQLTSCGTKPDHGGPGADHSIYKPTYSALTDVAQLVFLDHRGNGRSDPDKSANWNLAQWGDDVRGFCDALGIQKPVVLGVSFGGMVAMSYATRHPDHPAKLILVSTEAKGTSYRERRVELFRELGGAEVGALD